MGELQSARFTQGEAAAVKRLEDCATGRPSEVASHFTVVQTNPAVTKLQEALKEVQQRNPGLGIPAFEVSGTYDQNFANAILAYKTKRDIRNFANKFDNIVGIKTIKSLDSEKGPKTNPAPPPDPKKKPGEFPRQLPNCVPNSLCPPSKEIDVTLMAGVSGGEGVEIARNFFIIRDTTNGLSAVYRLDARRGFWLPFQRSRRGRPQAFQRWNRGSRHQLWAVREHCIRLKGCSNSQGARLLGVRVHASWQNPPPDCAHADRFWADSHTWHQSPCGKTDNPYSVRTGGRS
jgi:hypothetical protein